MSIIDNVFNWNEDEKLTKLLGKPSDVFNAFTPGMPAIQLLAARMGFSPDAITPAMKEELEEQIMSDVKRTGKWSGGIGYEDLGWDTMYNDSGEHIDVSKTGYLQNKNGVLSPQSALGLTGGKMDWSVDPITGKVSWGGSDYNFGTNNPGAVAIDKKNVGWNPNMSIDPTLINKEINAFSPYERYRQGQIQLGKPKEVIENSSEHYKMKFQEDKVPFKVIPDPWKTTQGGLGPNGGRAQAAPQVTAPVLPAPVKQTVINTPSNQTKFGANRSTAIKGGRGGRGNYSKPAAKSPSPVFKSYGPPNMQRFR